MKFAALDFETANYSHVSICAASVATFDDGELIESLYWLVRPPKGHGYFREDFTKSCHGLSWFDVQNEAEFPAIAPQLFARLAAADVVIAHNAAFDTQKLRATAKHFGLKCPTFNYLCTLHAARKVWPELENHQLSTVAAHVGHKFTHHQAREDAEAAGYVLLEIMKGAKAKDLADLSELFGANLVALSVA